MVDKLDRKYLSRMFDVEGAYDIDVFRQHEGYGIIDRVLEMDTDTIVSEMKKSNLRGRGGAGFPTGVKWSFMPRDADTTKYLVVNADEGEPGTFKDRYIMELDPHRLIEGCIYTAHALGLRAGYIFIRGELLLAARRLEQAIKQAYEANLLGENIQGKEGFNFDLYVHRGAGAYICGEETALIEGLEGKPGQPRMKPPFPAVVGLFNLPTLVNNVETIASVPFILEHGGDHWAAMGIEKNGGPKLYGLSGNIMRPGVYEAPCGVTLRELLEEYGGGMKPGYELKAIIPGGSSCAAMLPEGLDAPMGYETLREYGSSMGTGCPTFVDDKTCMVRLATRLAHFYHHESCGQCTPCREGTGWAYKILNQIESGRARQEDLDLLWEVCDNIGGNTICAHGDSIVIPVHSYIKLFPDEFQQHIDLGHCPFPAWRRRRDSTRREAAAE